MKILFVNEKCGYFGGVEQNIADTVAGLAGRGHECELAFGHRTDRGGDQYSALFARVHSCPSLFRGAGNDSELRQARAELDCLLRHSAPQVVYLHKLSTIAHFHPRLTGVRAVRMVHDHDLCCPRRHKYFFHSGRACPYPAGWRCYLDLAFLESRPGNGLGVGLVSIGRKIREMRLNYTLDKVLIGSRWMRDELRANGFPGDKLEILPPVILLITEIEEELDGLIKRVTDYGNKKQHIENQMAALESDELQILSKNLKNALSDKEEYELKLKTLQSEIDTEHTSLPKLISEVEIKLRKFSNIVYTIVN